MPQPRHKIMPRHGDDWGGPYVTAAFVCREMNRNDDGSITFDGAGTTVTIEMPSRNAVAKIVVAAVTGQRTGTARFEVVATDPRGVSAPPIVQEIPYGRSHEIAQCLIQVDLDDAFVGTYWLTVLIDGRFATKIPLRVLGQFPESLGEST